MTTTVCDLLNRVLATDTRWSCGSTNNLKLSDGLHYLVFCDDTGFAKLSVVGKAALVTAGDGKLISEWKRWWSESADPEETPSTEINGVNGINLAIIDLEKNEVIFDAGQKQVLFCQIKNEIKAFTSGSGGHHAASHLLVNACAKTAIEYASSFDHCTSKTINWFCYNTNENNLINDTYDYNVIVDGIVNRGRIVNLNTNTPSDFGCEIDKHPLAEEIKNLFTSGQAVASAPVPGIDRFKWTDETNQKFQKAMTKVSELRKK